MTNSKVLLLALLLPFLLLSSCKKKEQTSNVENRAHLSAYTQGMIYSNDPIIFRFHNNLNVDTELIKSALALEPNFDYTLEVSGRTLKIIPTKDLKRGTDYKVTLDLSTVFNDRKKPKVASLLKTYEQHVNLERQGLLLEEDGAYVEVSVTTALDETKEVISKLFDFPKSDISVEENSSTDFTVKLKFDPANGKQKINWDGKVVSAKEKGVFELWSYNADQFDIISTFYNEESKEYKIYFTKVLDPNQDISGLVQVGDKATNYTVKKNTLTVFVGSDTDENQNLKITKGIKSTDGKVISSDVNYTIYSEVIKPSIKWVSNGSYIPHDGTFKIPFSSIGLKSVFVTVVAIKDEDASRYVAWNDLDNMDEMEMLRHGELVYQKEYDLKEQKSSGLNKWNEFGLDFTEAFTREKGTIYKIYMDYGPSNIILNCENLDVSKYHKKMIDPAWFDSKYRRYNNYYDYDYNERRNPCHISYYLQKSALRKTIHCTNVFPIIKSSDDEVHVAVKELLNNNIASNAKVELLNLQGKPIASENVGSDGVASFSSLDRTTKAVRIEHQNEVSYFALHSGGHNPLTEFDISSNVKDVDNKMFVYTERDVWRPSDTIYMDIMLHHERFNFPEGLPILVKLINPKGVLYEQYIQEVNKDQSIYSFKMPTHLEAPTGYWKADITIGPLSKRKTLRVETIRPNVVDLTYAFKGQDKNWVYNSTLEGDANVQYLTGIPMRSGKVNANAVRRNVTSPFPEFKNFYFHLKDYNNGNDDLALWSATTDEKGVAKVKYNQDLKSHGGVSKFTIDSKIDLPGGGLNTETASFYASPYSSYVGIEKVNGRGWNGSFRYGETPKIEIVNVDQKGELKERNGSIELTVYKNEVDWWYDRYRLSRSSRSSYHSRFVEVHKENTAITNGKGLYVHDDPKFESGVYKIRAVDSESGHIAEFVFHHVNSKTYSTHTNPEFVELELETDQYAIGESIKMKLPQIPDAMALISLETGNRVLNMYWMDLNNPNVEIPIDKSMFPNFYLHVSIVQNYGQTNNDRPLRMYTVKKIKIDAPNKLIEPVITAPEKVEPDKSFTINVSEQSGSPMEYTVAVVDMGLLNLTGFQTPDPHKHFSKQLSLFVKTWDIFSRLIYHMNPAFAGIFSVGGDGALDKQKDEAADFNRFEPVVFHQGPFKISANETNTHQFDLPQYLGKVKVMVVAVNKNSFGSTEKNIKVVSPLMVQSQLPRALNVTDVVNIPVSVFKDEPSISNFNLSVGASNTLVKFKENQSSGSFGADQQVLKDIQLNTGEESGTVDITLDASAGKYTSKEETKLFINYPNSYSDKAVYEQLAPGESMEFDVDCFGFEKTKNLDLNVSAALLPNLTKNYHNLIQYPHGCLEQTTSKAFALMNIEGLMKLSPQEELKRLEYLDVAVNKIRSYQSSSGRFNYWRNGYYHAWSDLYVGNFLIDANDKNLMLKTDAIKLWIKYQTNIANKWRISGVEDDYYYKREQELQAYRLFLLAKTGKSVKSAMNRFRKQSELTQMAKMFLAGAYHFSSMDNIGTELFNEALKQGSSDNISSHSFGSSVRNKAIVVYIMSLFHRGESLDTYYRDWVGEINSRRWLSTQEQGFIFLACSNYFQGAANVDEEIDYEIKSGKFNSRDKLPSQENKSYHWDWDEMSGKATLTNHSSSKLYLTKTERAISKELYPAAKQNKLELVVKYKNLDGSDVVLEELKQGAEINIHVSVKNNSILDQDNLALTVKAASGWELLNPRLYGTNKDEGARFVFQDFRDDKVYTYLNLNKNQARSYTFRAKASLKGDYYLPSVVCENMYDGNSYAFNQASRTKIK